MGKVKVTLGFLSIAAGIYGHFTGKTNHLMYLVIIGVLFIIDGVWKNEQN